MTLEKMGEFFDHRLDSYDKHQLNEIEFAQIFYPYTARQLPDTPNCKVLDLGCGTGLELEEYFKINPSAKVIGIDLAPGMLNALRAKFPEKHLDLMNASYFDIEFPNNTYDAVVSVESLHHFTQKEKIPLYEKIHTSLKENGYFILTDYFATNDEEEHKNFTKLSELREQCGIENGEFYHYDTPLTIEHEIEALRMGGFANIEVLEHWKATAIIKAY